MNRVLTPSEVLGLEEGTEVFVEADPALHSSSRMHRVRNAHMYHTYVLELTDDDGGFWSVCEHDSDYGAMFRVWSLPQPPTPEELAANPWPEVHHE